MITRGVPPLLAPVRDGRLAAVPRSGGDPPRVATRQVSLAAAGRPGAAGVPLTRSRGAGRFPPVRSADSALARPGPPPARGGWSAPGSRRDGGLAGRDGRTGAAGDGTGTPGRPTGAVLAACGFPCIGR